MAAQTLCGTRRWGTAARRKEDKQTGGAVNPLSVALLGREFIRKRGAQK